MKTTNKLELTETQKKIILEVLLRELQSISDDIGKYAFNTNVSESLKEHKDRVYEIYTTVVSSLKDDEE